MQELTPEKIDELTGERVRGDRAALDQLQSKIVFAENQGWVTLVQYPSRLAIRPDVVVVGWATLEKLFSFYLSMKHGQAIGPQTVAGPPAKLM
jgi:hypothetical protein